MRNGLLIVSLLFVTLVAAISAASTPSAPAAKTVLTNCHQSGVVLLFWPKGHRAIPGAQLGGHPRPHVEIYKSYSYSSSNLLAFLSSNGTIRFSRKCEKGSPPLPRGPIPRNETLTRAGAVGCSIGTNSQLLVTRVSGGLKLDVGIPGTLVAGAKITARRPSVTLDNQFCRTRRPPR